MDNNYKNKKKEINNYYKAKQKLSVKIEVRNRRIKNKVCRLGMIRLFRRWFRVS